jgi:hypothetical protein
MRFESLGSHADARSNARSQWDECGQIRPFNYGRVNLKFSDSKRERKQIYEYLFMITFVVDCMAVTGTLTHTSAPSFVSLDAHASLHHLHHGMSTLSSASVWRPVVGVHVLPSTRRQLRPRRPSRSLFRAQVPNATPRTTVSSA